ncbi:MAG TPA: amidohydrolase family protein [Actinomycetota bacterium]|nr:amidohydrolase family protein [Actinomycetota bacterium]
MRTIEAELTWVDGAFRRDRAVVVDGDRIAAVVGRADVPAGAERDDWGRVALLPGTVNAHGHAFQSLLKGFADDRPFDRWRDDVLYPFSERLDGDAVYAGALFAFAEALVAGVTTTVDFFYLHDDGNDVARHVVRAARDIGIRLVLARAFYDPDAPTRAPARYRESADDAAARCRALAAELAGDPLVTVQPAPHSLHAAAPATIAAALDVARDLGVPCHLHLAEARYERDQVAERYGTTPVRLLAREGLLDERLVTVHTVWADDEELDLLAQSGAAVVHCPGANAFLGDGIARVPEMLRRGIRVALGPDGGCANNRQSVFDEMRTATFVAKARLLDGGALDAPTAFELGTRAGADVLGLPVGEIAAGRFADLVALDLDDLSLQPLETLNRHVVNSMQPTAIARIAVGGRVVAERGRPTLVDRRDVARLVADVTKGWTRP